MTLAVKVAFNPNTTNQQEQMNKYTAEIQGSGPDSNLHCLDKRTIPLTTDLIELPRMPLLGALFNPLPNHKILDMTKFKAFFLRIVKSRDYVDITKFKASAGDKSNVAKMTISL